MQNSLLFQASNPSVVVVCQIQNNSLGTNVDSQRTLFSVKPLRLSQPLCSLSLQSPQTPSDYTSTVGSSSPLNLSSWNLTHRHLTLLNVFACTTAICATWLFYSAIPALLAFKQAAESLEKLMDATREELPDTMAAIRLSGMEISDLTTELSDLGQEITQGVRSSTRAVRLAEQRLRRLTNVPPSPAFLQEMTSPKPEPDPGAPALARSVRGVKESIVKGRAFFQMFFSLTRFWRFAFNYMTQRK